MEKVLSERMLNTFIPKFEDKINNGEIKNYFGNVYLY